MNPLSVNAYNSQLNLNNVSGGENVSGSAGTDTVSKNAGRGNDSAALTKILQNLSQGDYLKGQVISSKGGMVELLLEDKTVVNAKVNSQADLSAGREVVFSVRSSDSSGLSLSPLFTNTDNSGTMERALDNAGLQSDERGMAMVNSMMHEGMNIGRDELIEMARSLYGIQTADIPEAVTLSKLGISVSEENITQFDAYLNYEHQVVDAVNDIMDLLPETLSGMMQQGDGTDALGMAQNLLNILDGRGAMEPMDAQTMELSGMDTPVSDVLSETELNELSAALQKNGFDGSLTEMMKDGKVSLQDTLLVIDDLLGKYSGDSSGTADGLSEEALTGKPQNLNTENPADSEIPELNTGENEGSDFLRKLMGLKNADTEIKGAVPEEKNAEKDGETVTGENSEKIPASLKELITSKPMASLLKASVNSQWKLTPEQVGEDKQVQNLYKRITEHTGRILSALENVPDGEKTPLARESSDLSHNMNFMNEMNNMFNYVQLPMRLQGNDAHGELYVYSNKKHMASKDGTVSALLHLDMDHLGPTDVYVSMNSSNHVNTHFYLQDDESLDLIALHIDELNEKLNKKGYSVNAEFTMKDGDTNVMQKILEENKSAVPLSVSNFDAKA